MVTSRFRAPTVCYLTSFAAWQNAERVSVRLAARGTVQEQETRYQPNYYQSYGDGSAYQQLPQHQVARQILPPPAKRQSSDSDEGAPKAKRPKTKGKTPTADGAQGWFTFCLISQCLTCRAVLRRYIQTRVQCQKKERSSSDRSPKRFISLS